MMLINYFKKKNIGIVDFLSYILIFSIFMGSNFIKFSLFGVKFNLSRILLLFFPLFLFINNFLKRNTKNFNFCDKWLKGIVYFFILWSIFSVLSFYKCKDIMFYFTVNFYICIGTLNILSFVKFVDIKKNINNFFKIIVFAIFINCLYYLWLYYVNNKDIGGFYYNANDLATVLLLAIPILIYLIFNYKKTNGCKFTGIVVYYFVVLSIFLFSFINICSRGCVIGGIIAIVLFFCGIISQKKGKKYISRNNVMFVTMFILILLSLLILFFKKYVGFINFKPIDNALTSNEVRVNLIYNGLYFLRNGFNLLTGIGTGNTIYYLKNYSIFSIHNTYSFHNFWLEILVEYGLVIFLLFLTQYIIICFKLFKNGKKSIINISNVFLVFLLAFVLASVSSSSMLTREWLWIIFAIIISYINQLQVRDKIK